ncbi:MAG TPA: flagellin [Bryobacteraceae bacterium]|nr:flagellin [Bryobacteraceae bacterium]
MIPTLNPRYQQFVNNLDRITSQMNQDQLNISSGVRMQNVSDNPDQVSELLQARASLASSQQISTNLSGVKTEVDTGEQTLQSAVQLFDQVQTLAAEGSTGTQTATTRATLAQQLQGIEQQFVGLANTAIEGRHIFAGDTDQVQPYTYDATQPNPVSAYQGSTSTRVALTASGTTFPVALTAQQIFDSPNPSNSVFGALNGLITALQNNDQTATQNVNSGLATVAQYLNDQLAFYGTTQDNVSAATDYASTQQTELQSQLSSLQDTDMPATILDMTQAQTQQQAALDSEAKLPRSTLFDFLA